MEKNGCDGANVTVNEEITLLPSTNVETKNVQEFTNSQSLVNEHRYKPTVVKHGLNSTVPIHGSWKPNHDLSKTVVALGSDTVNNDLLTSIVAIERDNVVESRRQDSFNNSLLTSVVAVDREDYRNYANLHQQEEQLLTSVVKVDESAINDAYLVNNQKEQLLNSVVKVDESVPVKNVKNPDKDVVVVTWEQNGRKMTSTFSAS